MYEHVTIGVTNYNGEHLLEENLSALKALNYPDYSIMLIDNNSTDKSIEVVTKKFPDVKIIALDRNTGENGARNAALNNAESNFVFLIENDAMAHKDCLKNLMDVMLQTPNAAVCSARVLFYHTPDIIQYDGTQIHYIGATVHEGQCAHVKDVSRQTMALSGMNGVILIDKQKIRTVGLFDEDYFLAWTEGEFSIRVTISGAQCMHVPHALVYHKVKKRGLTRAFDQVRARWYFILSVYSWRTLILIAPALFVYEIILFLFLSLKGLLIDYLKANIVVIKNIRHILRKRKKIQSLRVISDKDIFHSGNITISRELTKKKFFRIFTNLLNYFFDVYWRAVKRYV